MATPPPTTADRLKAARKALWQGNAYEVDRILRELIAEEEQDGLGDRGS